ncbi:MULTISPECIES: ABC transporter ATP-binding protein [Aeromicrobium]|uniref:ABC transporter ATP-binding protein n=1 Tax=Aeromicrobium phoceense TaxID=2754045 RepID=A0A838XJR1_9ACTN|nr:MULTISPECIES: ATP-binding cassette domain-containing protein [Aeromicrobium]MBA4607144.1 ABC transporter ATP-binding protein [Aeromicrobium phoceense]
MENLTREGPTTATKPALSVEDLVIEYRLARGGVVRAVDGVSFDVGESEIVGIVGESGSGKSSVGMVVAGFLNATDGRLHFDGTTTQEWGQVSNSGRAGVQMIFQDSSTAVNPRRSVGSIIAEAIAKGGRITKSHIQQSVAYIERVGLDPALVNRKPRELSGGQKQRVAIARALAARPGLLVCDESVSALDVSVRARILNLLVQIRRDEGIAILFISHDLAVVSQLVDRVVVMQQGKVVEVGPVRDVIDRPQHAYTQKLLNAIPRLERTTVSTHPNQQFTSMKEETS